MQNLFERLKPEAKVVIDEQADRYPLSVAGLTEELKSNLFLGDIKYNHIMWLARDSKLRKIAGMPPYDYVDSLLIINLSKLFND
jgi:hypothetical protein